MNDAIKSYYDFLTANPKADNATKGIEALKCLNKVDDELKSRKIEVSQAEELLAFPQYDGDVAAIKAKLENKRTIAKWAIGELNIHQYLLKEALTDFATSIALAKYERAVSKHKPSKSTFMQALTESIFYAAVERTARTNPQSLDSVIEARIKAANTFDSDLFNNFFYGKPPESILSDDSAGTGKSAIFNRVGNITIGNNYAQNKD